MEQRANVAGISIIASLALAVGKILAGAATGSAAVLASGIHSGVDLVAAVLAYFSVNQAKKPADEDHRYGHGKYENVAAVAEAVLILLAVALILHSAFQGATRGGGIHLYDLGIAVTGVSAVIGLAVSAMLAGAYRRTMSEAFRADSRHMLVNAGTSAAVCLGLMAAKYTGTAAVDSAIAVLIALILLKEGYSHLRKSAGGIFDARLSEREEEVIREVLSRHAGSYVQYHALRTRRSGPDLHVDLHLVVPRDQLISLTHDICDRIELDIMEGLPGVNIIIHAEPCRPVSGECRLCGISRTPEGSGGNADGCASRPEPR